MSTEANAGNEGRELEEFDREQHPSLLALCLLRGLFFGPSSKPWRRCGSGVCAVSPPHRLAVPLALLCLLPFAFCLCAQAQYSLDRYSIDGGGGTSTGGVFSVSGTIGQPDAGQLSGGSYTLSGGFWGIVAAIQTPGAPTLSVALTNGLVRVSWPQPAPGWLLEQTATPTGMPALWSTIAPPYQTNTTHLFLTVPPANGHTFYRLRKP